MVTHFIFPEYITYYVKICETTMSLGTETHECETNSQTY